VAGDNLRQHFEELETEVLPLTGAPAVEAIRRRGRRRQRSIRAAVLCSAVVVAAVVVQGANAWTAKPEVGPAGPVPTTQSATVPPSTTPAPSSIVPPTSREQATTSAPPTSAPAAARTPTLGPDGLGVVAFGASQQDALATLERRLGSADERRAWGTAATPFGTCPGPVRVVRWGRLYVLFTSGPTRYAPGGGWHLFAYQVDAVQRSTLDPQYSGSTPPPEPPPLHGDSPRTAAGVGFGSTLAELRQAYGRRVSVSTGEPGAVHRFQVSFGAAGALSGSLSGTTPGATITGIQAGAICGE
jgi:hypothetical protein